MPAETTTMTFEEFVAWYPSDRRYELIRGVVVEMMPTGRHEEIGAFIARRLILEIERLQLPYQKFWV